MKTVKDTQREITEIYQEHSYDVLKEALETWLSQDSDVKDDDLNLDTLAAADASKKTEDVSAAFDELFSN